MEAELSSNYGVKVKGYKSNASSYAESEALVNAVLEEFGQLDVLINNAGITRDTLLMRMTEEQWDEVIDTNLKSAFNLTKASLKPFLKQKFGSIINMTSVVGIMGNAGQANYAASKAGGDLQVLAAVRTHGVDACITRGANTYGPRQYPEKVIPLFVTNALDGLPLPLYGDGRQVREWLHVDDHCAAVELVLREGKSGEVYNVGGEAVENLELTRRIVELTGCDPALVRHVDDRPGHDRRYAVDDGKVRALGWEPRRSLEEGLAETVAWYRANRTWWEPIKSGEYLAYYRRQYGRRLGMS